MGKYRYEYEYPLGKEAQVWAMPHRPAAWDSKARKMRPAQPRQCIRFHEHYFGTNDANMARALEATVPFRERHEIRRLGVQPKGAWPPTSVAAGQRLGLLTILGKLSGIPLGGDNGALDAIRLE